MSTRTLSFCWSGLTSTISPSKADNEHVTEQNALLVLNLLAVLRRDDLLGRDDDAPKARALPHRLDAMLEIGLDLVLMARIRVDDVPAKHLTPTGPGRPFGRLPSRPDRWRRDRGRPRRRRPARRPCCES